MSGTPAPAPARWQAAIGLEVHAQLLTASKIFCGCGTWHGAPPNSQVCPVCLGHPGVLPVLNRQAVSLALRLALALGASIDRASLFARKNYFYPDLPKGYQISQYDRPLGTGGHLDYVSGGETRRIGFTRIHLEEDAGKLLHPERGMERLTRIDFNRCGTPLVEMVTAPDLTTPEEARALLARLRQLLVYLEVSDGNMEEGSLRCDANVSLRPEGEARLGVKTEIKNLNSFRNLERSLAHEIGRQAGVLESGGQVLPETRLWDSGRGVTMPMRSKEEAYDYRYFPEPDLKPLVIDDAWIEEVRRWLPELPAEREARLAAEYGIPDCDARVLASTRPLADYFEAAAREVGDGKLASNWVMTEVMRRLNEVGGDPSRLRVTAADLGRLLRMIAAGRISGPIAKILFEEMAASGESPETILAARGLAPIAGAEILDDIIKEVMTGHPGPVDDYLKGREAALTFLMGQAMRASGGRAEPGALRDRLLMALRRKKQGVDSP